MLSNFKPEKSPIWPFLLEQWSKIHKIGGFGCKKSSKFKEIFVPRESRENMPKVLNCISLEQCILSDQTGKSWRFSSGTRNPGM